jgi:ABC-type glycerol-3-phosphate transport system substrate-binding protein
MTTRKPNRKTWLALMMVGCLVMTGCGMNSANGKQHGEQGPGERSAEEVFTDFLDAMEDTVKQSGTTWPRWDRNDTADYVSEPCGVHARADGRLYQRQIEGGPVDDPQAAVERMKAHLEEKGYTIGNIFDNMGGNTTGIQLNARSPRRLLVQFTPSKETSFIKVVGECTLDPTAKKVTT